ncbi:MAG: hypothetical protein H0V68_11370 [Actinobacteria bacterium]|nr:hypothetical protein [Actinomycetota bacterium]
MTREQLPPPLPPESRTVGQLVAETLRLYGRHVLAALGIGVAPAVVDLIATELPRNWTLLFVPTAGGLALTAAFVAASVVATEVRPGRAVLATAFAAGVLVFVPFPFLASVFILPGLVWFALLGLAVPAAVAERLRLRTALARGFQLGRADFGHALGSLAALAIIVFLTRAMLFILLRGFGESTERAAAFLADLVVSPLLFLGAALLYVDQAARVRSSPAS